MDDQSTDNQHSTPQTLEELFRRYRPMLRYDAAGILGEKVARRADTSDLVQETMARAFRHVDQFRGTNRAEFYGWLKAIMRNEATRLRRYHSTEKRNVFLDVSSQYAHADTKTHDPELEAADHESMLSMISALASLPRAEREVVRLRALDSKSFDEIAIVMNRTVAAIKALWARGLRRLRRDLIDGEASTTS